MKIRIKGASLRLRLSRPEVERLIREGEITETTPFPGSSSLQYTLRRSLEGEGIDAAFHEGIITVMVPASLTTGWDTDDRIGFEANVPLQGGSSLFVLIEKDFQCLDDTSEDQSQNYPNPKVC
jgi:hypothetical protein